MAASTDGDIVGRGWSFPPRFDKRLPGVQLVSGTEDIEESLTILFATAPGDRVLQPRYGCDVRRFLFRPMDLTAQTELKDVISRAILNWEPRITVNAIAIDGRDYLDGIVRVELDYTVRATNSRSNRVFPLYKQQGTNLER